MARIKATCSACGKTISLFFDDRSDDWDSISKLNKDEAFEHKCPACEAWTTFETVEEAAEA